MLKSAQCTHDFFGISSLDNEWGRSLPPENLRLPPIIFNSERGCFLLMIVSMESHFSTDDHRRREFSQRLLCMATNESIMHFQTKSNRRGASLFEPRAAHMQISISQNCTLNFGCDMVVVPDDIMSRRARFESRLRCLIVHKMAWKSLHRGVETLRGLGRNDRQEMCLADSSSDKVDSALATASHIPSVTRMFRIHDETGIGYSL